MKTLEQLKSELKNALTNCNHANDGSLAAQVNNNIQWAWENWDVDFSSYHEGEKPETYTPSFRDEWIENEPFDVELEQINSGFAVIETEIENYPNAEVYENESSFFVDLRTGLGAGEYPKDSFTLEQAIADQVNYTIE